MKIAIIAPFSNQLSTLHGLAFGLQECGHEWIPIESKPLAFKAQHKNINYTNFILKQAENCDTLLIAKGTNIPVSTFSLLQDKQYDTTYWCNDSVSGNGCGPPGRPKEIGPRGKLCTRIMLTGTEGARWFRKQGYIGRMAQIYQGCRHHIWKPGESPRTNQERITFLGSIYSGDGDRSSKFRAITGAGYSLYHSKRCFHEAAANVYWNSAICPNFVCGDITSNRVTRILASGGFCLTERNIDITHSFTDGKELAIFERDNIPQMLELIAYYMQNQPLREKIAMAGHAWTRDKGWPQQAEKMVRFIKGEDVPADGASAQFTNLWKQDEETQ